MYRHYSAGTFHCLTNSPQVVLLCDESMFVPLLRPPACDRPHFCLPRWSRFLVLSAPYCGRRSGALDSFPPVLTSDVHADKVGAFLRPSTIFFSLAALASSTCMFRVVSADLSRIPLFWAVPDLVYAWMIYVVEGQGSYCAGVNLYRRCG